MIPALTIQSQRKMEVGETIVVACKPPLTNRNAFTNASRLKHKIQTRSMICTDIHTLETIAVLVITRVS